VRPFGDFHEQFQNRELFPRLFRRCPGEREKAGGVKIPKLFTIGYQGSTPSDLIDRLLGAGVERVVDVRELPLSRRRGFSKSPLAAALTSAGIRYEHVRALGNPKPNRWRRSFS